VITLRDQSAVIVGLVPYGGSTGLDGGANQSLTRSPDLVGKFTLHLGASGGARAFSPGTQLSGRPFDACSPIVRVEVSPSSATIQVGGKQQFTARAFDSNSNEIPGVIFSWQSSSRSIATVDHNGLATSVSVGSTEIGATGRGVQSPPATLTVNAAAPILTSVSITPNAATLGVGETQQFTAQAKDQNGQDIQGVTITFDSSDPAVALVDSVSATSNTGSATANVASRASGVTLITATANNGSINVRSKPATITVEPGAGQLLISEFRTRGARGASDEFIELYNPTNSTITIGGLKIRASNGSGTMTDRVTVTIGTRLGSGCHYLIANSLSGGYSGLIPPDQIYGTGLTDDGGIAITRSNGTTIIDASGMSNGSAFKEGTPLAPLSANANQSYERKPGAASGNSIDTDNNTADFFLNAASSNPQDLSSACLDLNTADLSITNIGSPDPVRPGGDLTYTINVTNNGPGIAHSVVMSDTLPDTVTFVSCSSTSGGVCGGDGNNRTTTFGALASGASVTIMLVATANGADGSSLTNTATVTSVTSDANPANNSSTATTSVQSPPPALSINDVALSEGNNGTTTFAFTVSLGAPAPSTGVTFDIATVDGTATSASSDYVSRSLTAQTIPAGQQTYIFEVTINGDTLVEPNETFFIGVTNVLGATVTNRQGLGTIQNDDTASLVISQVYPGGGNTGARYTHDFVEVFNHGTAMVNFAVTPYSIQYAGANANFGSNRVDLTSGLLGPGHYFLIQMSSGGTNGAALPAPDATGSINMASTAGKVALVVGTTALPASTCPGDDGLAPFNPNNLSIADFVGYGTTANCYEGPTAPAPATSNTTAAFRKSGGCLDTNDNSADFFSAAPFPRNTSSPANDCIKGNLSDLSIDDVTALEGDSGTATFTFTVSRSAAAPSSDVTFDIATQNNTATIANNDYVARTLTHQVIPAGQQTFSFEVAVKGDTTVEPDETFFVNVTNVSGAGIADGQGVGTIKNDDLPSLFINDVALNEGNTGTTTFTFTVRLSAPAPNAGVTFDVATQNNTADVSDEDYVTLNLTGQTIPAGSQSYTFDVTVNGDTLVEPTETFFVNVTNVSGATVDDAQGLGTIQNDDSPMLSINDVTLTEGNSGTTTFTFTVTSSIPAPAGGISFDIATHDNTATVADNDYAARSLTGQTIIAGNTTYTFDVTVNGDTNVETNEFFFVNLTNVSNATMSDGQGLGTIKNDDVANLVISQVYAGGGNNGAQYKNDFVEIFNRGTTTVSFPVTPYSLQYAGAAASFGSSNVDLTSGTIVPGQYFLVQLSSGGANGVTLPTPDATGSIAMAATAGKLALIAGTSALSGSGCPLGGTVADFVGYGTTANCFEGLNHATAPSNTTADFRKDGGCNDTNDNAADFLVSAPFPRNTSSPLNNCIPGTPPSLTISDVTIKEGNTGTTAATFTVTLSAAPSTDVTFGIATQDNTATTADSDYVGKTLTNQVIPAGQTTYTFSVTVNGDAVIEPDESFLVNITNIAGATTADGQAVGTIQNDDLPTMAINDVALTEGNGETKLFTFTVNLSTPAPAAVSFDIATADGTAQDGDPSGEDNDYVARALSSQTIPSGSSTYTFDVLVNGDLTNEANEMFFVNLTNVSGAVVGDAQGVGTILNDDSPSLTISDVSQSEGASGTTTFSFTVTSSLPAPTDGIAFDITTADGSAQDDTPPSEDNDYAARSLHSQIIAAGNTTYTFEVTVNGDTLVETNETFFVNVTNVSNATVSDAQGQGTIQNDDTPLLVISQIYGGGGNTSATYKNDFIEIFNRGTTTVDFSVTPYSVQYAAVTSNFSTNKTDINSGLLLPGHYFLIQEASGGAVGAALPTPEKIGTINLAATSGKVVLITGAMALTGSGCPLGGTVADFLGYGSAANCFETAPISVSSTNSNARSVVRTVSCTDSNNNSADFSNPTNAPVARNSATTSVICP
jgi:uncharacterized repeat protein (TIGR01451 family)